MARNSVPFCTVLAALGLFVQPSLAGTVEVTPSSMGSWAFDNRGAPTYNIGTEPTAVTGMVAGPATPPLGIGSAELGVGNGITGGDGAAELGNIGFAGTALSAITALSYSTYDVTNNGSQFPYLRLYVSFDGGATLGDVFFFEPPYQTTTSGNPSLPPQGPEALNTWQSWNALEGGWWSNNGADGLTPGGQCTPGTGVESLSDCLTADGSSLANAVIFNPTDSLGDLLGGVRFDVGVASPDEQFLGYVDDFTIGIGRDATTFDFDPDATTTTSAPEPVTLSLFGAGLAGMVAMRRRRRRIVKI
jgi:hypothetical protein